TSSTSGGNERPRKLWTLKLAWSEYRNGAWTAPRQFTGNALMHARLYSDDWDRDAFYIRPSVQDLGVALNIYLVPGNVLRSDTIQSGFHLERVPIGTLDFDGDELRMAAGVFRYRQRLSQNDQFTYLAVVSANDP